MKKKPIKEKIKKYKIVPKFFIKERDHTIKESKTSLSKEDAMMIAIMAIISAFIAIFVKIMQILRFSTFPNNSIFISWHPYAAPIGIVGILLYIYCIWRKGITYWLAYFPAFIGIFYWTIEYCMIHSIITPQQLADMFSWIGEDIPEWLTGPRLPSS